MKNNELDSPGTGNDFSRHKYIMDRLICPVCQAGLSVGNDFLKCTDVQCGKEFPVVRGIPVLINEDDSIFSMKDYSSLEHIERLDKNGQSGKLKNLIRKRVKRFIEFLEPNISCNLSSRKNFDLLRKLLSEKEEPKILIIGGAIITTNTQMIINDRNIVVESDVSFGPRTQMIIDGHHIPFMDETFDLLIYQAVLEHVADPYQCVREAHRVLKKDGLVFAATPFMQQVHGKQHDFTRFTHLGHRRLFRSFVEIESGIFAGTGVALAWSINYFFRSLTNFKPLRLFLSFTASVLFFWLKYIDYITYRNKGAYNGASGLYFIGKKSENILSDKELVRLYRGV